MAQATAVSTTEWAGDQDDEMTTAARTQRDHRRAAEPAPPTVMVGVDGSQNCAAAVNWAADRAVRGHRRLTLLAVLDERWPRDGHHQVADPENPLGSPYLQRIREQLVEDHPDLSVDLQARVGSVLSTLLDVSDDQLMLVVGRRGLGALGRIALGSVSVGVAGRAGVPVVVVPSSWDPELHREDPVVVGRHPTRPNAATLEFAYAEAAVRGAELIIVDVPSSPRHRSTEGSGAGGDQLLLKRLSRSRPEVRLRTVEQSGRPDEVLSRQSAAAQLLVLGRHRSRLSGLDFGSTVRAALHRAQLPVAVVPAFADRSA